MPTQQAIHNAQKVYVTELSKILPYKKRRLWKFVRMLWPTIEVLENEENTTTLRVIMSPFINLIGSIGCGDMNAQYHTSGGVMQTLSLIGVCSAVTSHFRPGYALTKIDAPINFRTAVPIGAPLILKASIVRSRTSVLVIELDGWIEDTGVKLFTQPRRITLKLIPD